MPRNIAFTENSWKCSDKIFMNSLPKEKPFMVLFDRGWPLLQ